MLKVTYVYSACVIVESSDCKVVSDPWFTEGAFDGSWYQYPRIQNPIETIGPCDFIYISHIHPDHYDPTFLKEYLARYSKTRVLIADFKDNFLSHKMKRDGIQHKIISELKVGQTALRIFPNEMPFNDIDSALVIKHDDHSVVNMNDNVFNQVLLDSIRDYCGSQIKIAMMGYTGAGHYPQTYYRDPEILITKAKEKKLLFFERYRRMRDVLRASVNIPFAGQYILGGRLADLNAYRGVADATEVLGFDPHAVVLADGGKASIDTETLKPTAMRTIPYDLNQMREHGESLKNRSMHYEKWLALPSNAIPLERHLPKAYQNALRRSRCQEDYYFCIKQPDQRLFVMNAKQESSMCEFVTSCEHYSPRSEIDIDPQYLFGLLTGIFHWNNAEVGSQYFTTRTPDIYNPAAQSFLNFFHL